MCTCVYTPYSSIAILQYGVPWYGVQLLHFKVEPASASAWRVRLHAYTATGLVLSDIFLIGTVPNFPARLSTLCMHRLW